MRAGSWFRRSRPRIEARLRRQRYLAELGRWETMRAEGFQPCFVCGTLAVCGHREPELVAWQLGTMRKPPGRETAPALARKAAR